MLYHNINFAILFKFVLMASKTACPLESSHWLGNPTQWQETFASAALPGRMQLETRMLNISVCDVR